jgi:hypothetical protein
MLALPVEAARICSSPSKQTSSFLGVLSCTAAAESVDMPFELAQAIVKVVARRMVRLRQATSTFSSLALCLSVLVVIGAVIPWRGPCLVWVWLFLVLAFGVVVSAIGAILCHRHEDRAQRLLSKWILKAAMAAGSDPKRRLLTTRSTA